MHAARPWHLIGTSIAISMRKIHAPPFVKYRRDLASGDLAGPLGGGLMAFTVELRASEEDLELARRALRQQGVEDPILSPIPVRGGTAKLAMVMEENRINPMIIMKKQPMRKLRSRKIARRTNGSGVVSECAKK